MTRIRMRPSWFSFLFPIFFLFFFHLYLDSVHGAITISYPDPPLFWNWTGALSATTAGGGVMTIIGDYFLSPGQCTIAPVVLFTFNDGSTASCNVINQDPQTLTCTVPPGSGAPHVTINICGQLNRDLPRMPTDFVFYVGDPPPINQAWCTQMIVTNANGFKSASKVYICTADTRQKLSATAVGAVNRPLFTWSTSDDTSKRCINIIDPNDRTNWLTKAYLCTEKASTYNFKFVYPCTDPICAQQCLQILNPLSTSVTFTSGLAYICTTTWPSPFPVGDTWLNYHYAPPSIDTVTPNHAPTTGGTIITFTGSSFGFQNVSSIIVGPAGASCPISFLNHTYATCVLPSGQGTSNFLQIIVNGQTSNNVQFSYEPPVIYSVLPQLPDASGGAPITITGLNFGTSGTVSIGVTGRSCYPVMSYNNTIIICATPPGQGINQSVSVGATGYPANLNVNVGKLTYLPPVVYSVTPSNYETVGSIPITIVGKSFGESGVVVVGGQSCSLTGTGYSTNLIQCVLPAGQGANLSVTVTASSQMSNSNVSFSYNPPNITAVTPQGGSGSSLLITIAGTSFGIGASDVSITVDNIPCTPSTGGWAQRRVLCTATNGAGLFLPVVMTVAGQRSNTFNLSYAPVVTSVTSPDGRVPVVGGITLNVTGLGFSTPQVANAIVFTGPSQCPVQVQTPTWITCTLPPGGGTVSVTVTVLSMVSAPYVLDYDAPSLTGLTPRIGPAAGGTVLTLTGINFGATPSVTVGGALAVMLTKSDTMLTVRDVGGSGITNAVIVNAGGGLYTSSLNFGYYAPSLTSIYPVQGPAVGGYNLTLTGGNFSSAILLTFVVISGASVSPVFQNDTTIIITMPPIRNGLYNIFPSVLVNGQTTTQAVPFQYQGANIVSVLPANGPTVGGIVMTITGTNFGLSGYVLVGLAQATLTGAGYSDTYIECILPPGQGPSPVSVVIGTAASQSYPWSYAAPSITLVSPSNAATSGNVFITVTGTNFGSSGTLTMGSYACITNIPGSSYTASRIVCQLPPGQGANLPVVILVSTLVNAIVPTFSYNPPVISGLSPTNGPTNGGGTLTIFGSNFGLVATSTFVSAQLGAASTALVCAPFGLGQSHTQIQCVTPPYQGSAVPVFVNVSGQISNPYDYRFNQPVIATVSPLSSPTQGGINITLVGTNFGTGRNSTLALNNQLVTSSFYNHSMVVFLAPSGAGANVPLVLTVADQPALYFGTVFSYRAPVVSSVAGCTDNPPITESCPTSPSAITITITGSNFYNDPALINVTINALNCTGVVVLTPHTRISCLLPSAPAGGFNLPVAVTVKGLTGSAALLSYAGPTITTNSIQLDAQAGASTGFVQLVDDPTPTRVRIKLSGRFWGSDVTQLSIKYGMPGATKNYDCLVDPSTFVAADSSNNFASNATCSVGPGIGANLTFVVMAGLLTSAESADRLSYARPVIVPNTIRASLAGSRSTTMTGLSSQGDSVFFDVAHVGAMPGPSLSTGLSITYGFNATTVSKSCTQVHLDQDASTSVFTISCLTGSGAGSNYSFVVTAGNQASERGTDLYSYHQAPAVTRVRGCADVGSSTSQCPTVGGTLITVEGTDFTQAGLSVTVGSQPCLNVVWRSPGLLTCVTPAGAGSSVPITVTTGILYSVPTYLFSYADASVVSISGCSSAFSATIDCPRVGGTSVVIRGANFGPANATVLIDGGSCSVLTSNHTTVTCIIPSGTQTLRSVILIQNGGTLSIAPSGVYVSYLQCAPGSFAATSNVTCGLCGAGTYADVSGLAACKNCQPGWFTAAVGATVCSQCTAGTFSGALAVGAVGATSCTNCTAGWYNTGAGSSTCLQCAAGKFNPLPGQMTCSSCSPGYFSGTSGSTRCEVCESGRYSSFSGAVSCLDCPIGTIANSTGGGVGTTSCVDCPAGSVSTSSGQTSCAMCTPGFYAPTSRMGACLGCEPGTFSNDTGLTSCYTCGPGTYSFKLGSAGATQCTKCPKGYYTDASNQGECLACEQGTYSSSLGATACSQCGSGYFAAMTGSETCDRCPVGTYASGNGTITCTDCPVGSYNDQLGATSCQMCALGSVQNVTGSTRCSSCAAGTYMPSLGQAACLACDSGYYMNDTNAAACTRCPAGGYCSKSSGSLVGPKLPVNCSAGYYSAGGTESCQACDAGQYQPLKGQSSCLRCPVGQSSLLVGATACMDCVAGTYSDTSGALRCADCPIGHNNSVEGAVSCSPCSSGYFSPGTGSLTCFPCAAGTYTSLPGQGSCLNCPSGSYSALSGSSACALCEVGSYQATSGSTRCQKCAAGSSQGVAGQVACEKCPAGSFNALQGSASCQQCPTGTASSLAGVTSCSNCTAGTFSSTPGQLSCLSCPIGSFSSVAAASSCSKCLAGTYNSVARATTCSLCLEGSYSDVAGAIQCNKCSPGSFTASNGTTSCVPCAYGSYQPLSGNNTCLICPGGTYANTLGAQSCLVCPAGSISTVPDVASHGSSSCSECPAGFYQPTAGGVSCLPCDRGTFTSQPGQASCVACPAGSVAPFTGMTDCTSCGPGTSQSTPGSASCPACPAGQFSNATRGSSCQNCAPGSFTDELGQIECDLCAPGMYQSLAGEKTCVECDGGTYTNNTGSASCIFCPPGSYQPLNGTLACLSCPAGKYQSQSGQTTCVDCPIGTFSGADGASVCASCPAGSFQNTIGSTFCYDCAPGSFQGKNRQSSCDLCPVGTMMPNPAASACSPCVAGKFASVNGSLDCQECLVGTYAPTQGLSSCLLCFAGSFQDSAGQSTCQNCAHGTASNTTGRSVSCDSCDYGKYAGVPGMTECSVCEPGSYGPTRGLSSCLLCLPGKYLNHSGGTECDSCPPGFAQSDQGQMFCDGCTPGSYSLGGQAVCTRCPTGTFNNAYNSSTVCASCGKGKEQQNIGATFCVDCPPGSASTAEVIDTCPLCGPGSYQPRPGKETCLPCPDGTYQDEAGASECKLCPPGTYNGGTSAKSCTLTSKGYFTDVYNSTEQKPCLAGFYQPGVNSTGCLRCPLGHKQASQGQESCDECAPGEYASELNSTVCVGCSPGFYEPDSGSSMCSACPPGTFTNVMNKLSCDPCDAGSYSDTYNSSICLLCPKGSYQPMTNSTRCEVCTPGTYTDTPGASQCALCSRGFAQAGYNSTQCDPCTPGHAQGTEGQSQCAVCTPGSYSNTTSLSSCNLCVPGYYTTSYGALACDECPLGQAQPEYGSTTCNNCEEGTYSDQMHLESCFACPTGQFGVNVSATRCDLCPVGQAQADTGQTTCELCEPGYFVTVPGQESCAPCDPGSHSVDYGAVVCEDCQSGQYQGGSGQARCLDCPAGTYHNGTGATQCEECNYGEYQDEAGSLNCNKCEPGYFKDTIGAGSCWPCWPGEFTTGYGQKACSVCPAGTHSNVTLAIQCDPCERGTANAAVNQSSCASCTPGFYMPNTGQSECLLCPIGTYSAGNGSTQCLECPIGSYQQIQGQSSCLACPLGQTTGGTGATFCTDCPTGTFGARNGTVSICSPCHAGTFSVTPGAMVCRDCPAGMYSEEGQTFCTECPELTVAASPGSAMCVLCDRNSLSDLGHTACMCNPGYYLPSTHIPGSSYFTCELCPFGADCTSYGTSYYNLKALEGFWRSSNETLNFYRCPISKYCTGGEATAPSAVLASDSLSHTSCLNHRAGIMCTTCELGYHEQAGGSCVECPTGGVSWISVALIGVAIVFLVWIQIYVIIRAGREAITRGLSSEAAADSGSAGFDDDSFDDDSDLTTSSSEYESDSDVSESASTSSMSASQSRSGSRSSVSSRSVSSKSKASVSRPSHRASQLSRSKSSANSDEASVSCSRADDEYSDEYSDDPEEEEGEEESEYEFSDSEDEEPNNPIERIDPARINFHLRYGPPEKAQDFTYKLKIFLSFFQVATNLGTNLNIVWPNTYINFLLFFDIVNFDFALSSVASADCIGSFNYYNKFVAIVLAPLVILVFTVIFYLLPNYLECGPFRKYTLQERQRGKMNFWRLFLYLLFLVYPSVSSTVLRLYVCKEVDDASFLSADLRVECYTDTWTTYTYVSLILILLYPIGIPVFFFSLLRMNQNNLREPRVKAQLGFLYGGYRGECWWFEITENIHKLTLTSILGFFPEGAQLPTGMGICVGYFLILLLVNPYLSSFDDMLALYSECEIFLLVTAGWIFYNNPESATEDDLLLSICLIIITLFFVLAFLFAVFYVMAVVVIKWKAKRKIMFMSKQASEEPPLEILPPVKPPKREFRFVKEWLEDEEEEKDEFSQSLSQSHHSRASLSEGSDWSDDGQLGIDADGQRRARRSQIVQPGTSVHPFQMGNDDAPAPSGPKESISLAAKADAILAAPQMKVREIESDEEDEDDDVVDVFGLDIDDDGTGEPRNVAKKKKKRHDSDSSSDDGGHERDDVDDLADLMAPRVRREGEDEDITKHMTNIINARE